MLIEPASKATEPPSGGDSKPPGEKKGDTPAASSGMFFCQGIEIYSTFRLDEPGNAGASKFSGEPSSEKKPAADGDDSCKPAPSAGPDTANKPPTGSNPSDKVHISFDGSLFIQFLLIL